MHEWETYKPQVYLKARQESLRSWRNWVLSNKDPRLQGNKLCLFRELVHRIPWESSPQVQRQPEDLIYLQAWEWPMAGDQGGCTGSNWLSQMPSPQESSQRGSSRCFPMAVQNAALHQARSKLSCELPQDRSGLYRYISSKRDQTEQGQKGSTTWSFFASVFTDQAYL